MGSYQFPYSRKNARFKRTHANMLLADMEFYTNSGRVGVGTKMVLIPPVNAQNVADLSLSAFDEDDKVKSHSVIYWVPDERKSVATGTTTGVWYKTRKESSYPYWTLANEMTSWAGEPEIDERTGLPKLNDRGELILKEGGTEKPKRSVAVEALVPGHKYVLRAEGDKESFLKNGELCYWDGDKLRRDDGNHICEFIINRYEYNTSGTLAPPELNLFGRDEDLVVLCLEESVYVGGGPPIGWVAETLISKHLVGDSGMLGSPLAVFVNQTGRGAWFVKREAIFGDEGDFYDEESGQRYSVIVRGGYYAPGYVSYASGQIADNLPRADFYSGAAYYPTKPLPVPSVDGFVKHGYAEAIYKPYSDMVEDEGGARVVYPLTRCIGPVVTPRINEDEADGVVEGYLEEVGADESEKIVKSASHLAMMSIGFIEPLSSTREPFDEVTLWSFSGCGFSVSDGGSYDLPTDIEWVGNGNESGYFSEILDKILLSHDISTRANVVGIFAELSFSDTDPSFDKYAVYVRRPDILTSDSGVIQLKQVDCVGGLSTCGYVWGMSVDDVPLVIDVTKMELTFSVLVKEYTYSLFVATGTKVSKDDNGVVWVEFSFTKLSDESTISKVTFKLKLEWLLGKFSFIKGEVDVEVEEDEEDGGDEDEKDEARFAVSVKSDLEFEITIKSFDVTKREYIKALAYVYSDYFGDLSLLAELPLAITFDRNKALNPNWIPAFCRDLDYNEILVPGTTVDYGLYSTHVRVGDVDIPFTYAEVVPPSHYQECVEGTPELVMFRIKHREATNEEGSGDGDFMVTEMKTVNDEEGCLPVNVTYYPAMKLDSDNSSLLIREPFGAMNDCKNTANLAAVVKRDVMGRYYPFSCRLDYVPFGYAVPTRSISCFYKSANDNCSPKMRGTTFEIEREESGTKLNLFGACYIPNAAVTKL